VVQRGGDVGDTHGASAATAAEGASMTGAPPTANAATRHTVSARRDNFIISVIGGPAEFLTNWGMMPAQGWLQPM
jgi:hypothetical protein